MSRKIIIALIGAAVVMAAGCSKNTQGNVNGGNARNEASLEEGSETLNETQTELHTTEAESMGGQNNEVDEAIRQEREKVELETETTQAESTQEERVPTAEIGDRIPSKYLMLQIKEGGRIEHITYTAHNYFGDGEEIEKSANVYLPYGYSEEKRYNVLYLMHGIGGDENEWEMTGNSSKVKCMMDNLAYYGDIEPFIVVTPNGRSSSNCTASEDYNSFYVFGKELRNDLIPYIEKNYSTYADYDENGYDIVSRSYKGTKLYVGLNIKDVAQTVEIPVSENNGTVLKDLYSGKTYTVSNGKIKVIIPAATDGGTVVLENNSSTNGGSTGGSSSSGSTTTETKPSEDTKKDTTTIVIPAEKLPEGTTATVTVTKDASGKVTAEAAVAATGKTSKTGVKATVNADVIQAVTEAAGTKDVTITQEVKKADGTTAYTVQVNAADVKAGAKLAVMKKDEKTGELVLVNKKSYKVTKDGSVSLTFKDRGVYVLKTQAEVKAAAKQIAKTIAPAKSTVNIGVKKTTVFQWSKKLNMENVAKITYKSSKKSVVSVNKNGKITGKKKGTGKVTAEVTLKDGTKKTVRMKVKVK